MSSDATIRLFNKDVKNCHNNFSEWMYTVASDRSNTLAESGATTLHILHLSDNFAIGFMSYSKSVIWQHAY